MILLDMDGVVADFFNAALRWHGGTPLKSTWPRNQWDMASVLGISEKEFNEPLLTSEFWDDIRPYPGAQDFVSTLCDNDVVQILTVSTGDHRVCSAAKIEWCRYWLGVEQHGITICTKWQQKIAYAEKQNKEVLIIDDHVETCETAKQRGVKAILVQRPWNTTDLRADFDRVDYSMLLRKIGL